VLLSDLRGFRFFKRSQGNRLTSEPRPDTFLMSFVLVFVPSVRASLPLGKDWEAGENPALPRNCKRGNRSRH
jgi:hypothetical protein